MNEKNKYRVVCFRHMSLLPRSVSVEMADKLAWLHIRRRHRDVVDWVERGQNVRLVKELTGGEFRMVSGEIVKREDFSGFKSMFLDDGGFKDPDRWLRRREVRKENEEKEG